MAKVALKNRIREFLNERGIKPYGFCKAANISQNTGYGLVKDETRIPDPVVLGKICNAYRVQPSELIYWVADEELKAS